MDNSAMLWPSNDMDFWEIKDDQNIVLIKWSQDVFKDYKELAYNFYDCGISTLNEIISSGHDNIKSDMWFLTGVFLIRQSIELGLKSLLCRITKKNHLQIVFKKCKHNLLMLFQEYDNGAEEYLTEDEKQWLIKYLTSLEEIDSNSDMFRFPFEDEFLSKYRNKFLDIVHVANNLLQAFNLVKKCIQKGTVSQENIFDNALQPSFFIFSSHGIGNCYLWQSISDDGFHVKVTGYNEVINYIYNDSAISKEIKFYPLMFMFRNAIELCLKRLFFSRVDDGVPLKVFFSKRKSHLLKKDLWNNVKPIIMKYVNDSYNDMEIVTTVERLINDIDSIDKNGDMFRYPTSYSLEYRFNNKCIDINNTYEYLKSIINFLDGCDSMLSAIAEYQSDMRNEYESEMAADFV